MTVSTGPLVATRDAHEIVRACAVHDLPDIPPISPRAFAAGIEHPWPGETAERHLGYLGGTPVGYLQLGFPQEDNLDTVDVELHVLPAHRRRGVGRALFALARERAAEQGRTHLIGPTTGRHPDGAAFARAMGAVAGLEQHRSRLDLRTADQARLDALLAQAWSHADGYRLVQWTGAPPDEIIDDVAYLDGRLRSDAPIGNIAWEPEKVDADRIRATELCGFRRGRTTYHTGAATGDRLIAWTTIVTAAAAPAHAWQAITLVDPDHRGRRLGLLVKLANLAHARHGRPALETIDTFNALTNGPMIRVNEQLGFRVVDSSVHWQWTA